MQTTFIFGHKNPDTDTVCSSIALSYLKNQLGEKTVPKVLGHLNNESKFVLDYFNIKEPKFLNDIRIQIRNVAYNKQAMISENASIFDTVNLIQKLNVTAMPLVSEDKALTGFITLKEIARALLGEDKTKLFTNYENIVSVLEGKEVLKYVDEFSGDVLVGAYQSQTFKDNIELNDSNIIITGDRYKILEHAVNNKVKLIIITGGHELDADLLEIAKKNKVSIIETNFDTFETANRIFLCNYIKNISYNNNYICLNELDYYNDFIEISKKNGHNNYPVKDNKGKCLGMLRLTEASNYEKKKVILVDHNQFSQSVYGIEEADIVEIVDHHNLGVMGTTVPISFRCMPVGCTCTIIYDLFKENNVEIPKDIAGIMLSAILSDTLILKSPTTTEKDRFVVNELARITGLNYQEYGIEMFKAASSIKGMPINDVIFQDFKSFNVGNTRLGIGQVMTLDYDEIDKNKEDYIAELNKIANDNYMAVALFVTDIIKNGSYILFNEAALDIVREAYGNDKIEQGTYLDGFVSRKKQMLPSLLEEVEKRA
ncbi:MAG: putative manganese-dependent inorganic diphosphatase [Bacilli bacterium]|nr:putative manganese-dependent inorganic diphosphatase [Bacilli bacterium]